MIQFILGSPLAPPPSGLGSAARSHLLLAAGLLCLLLGCEQARAPHTEAAGAHAEGLRVAVTPRAIAYDYAARDNLITAAAGDTELVFVAEPLAHRIAVLDRVTGVEIGFVPPPPDGWLLPFALRVPEEGKLVVLDSGGLPDPNVPAVARVYDYAFEAPTRRRPFRAHPTRTVRFDGLPVIFGEDVEVTPSGYYVVAESVIGALWLIAPDGTITPGLFPDTAPIAELGACTWPTTEVDGIPFATAGNFAPGVVSVAERRGQIYFGSTCRGGLYRIALSTLRDGARSSAERAREIVTVSPRPADVDAETLHGLAFDRSRPHDPTIYAADSLRLQVLAIDTRTGARRTVLRDSKLLNFPVKPQFLPPLHGVAPLLVPSDQEHRFAVINAAIEEDRFQPPWLVTKLVVF